MVDALTAGRSKGQGSLERKLATYAIAGGAVLVAAEEGQAGIVYSGPQNIPIGTDTTYNLDLNGDSVVDLQFLNKSFTADERALKLNGPGTTFVADGGNAADGSPGALNAGVDVGSQTFAQEPIMVKSFAGVPTTGNWLGATNKFLGLQFQIGAETHYGWAQLSISDATGDTDIDAVGTGTLIDWAYEDVAGASLLTGQTVAAVPEPTSLILLATGAAALGAYRALRRKRVGDVASDSQTL